MVNRRIPLLEYNLAQGEDVLLQMAEKRVSSPWELLKSRFFWFYFSKI